MMETNHIDGYARALLDVTLAEGDADRLSDELFSVALAFGESEELQGVLGDPLVPFEKKQSIVGDLIGGRASKVTVSLVNMLVGVSRLKDFGAITKRMMELAAEAEGHVVAEVRSAVELDDATQKRLVAKLSAVTGRAVKLNVVVDPSVIGGLVAQVEDTLFDGSVRNRLLELREAWA
ncbi:MAG: ATP synthase F1 subunit delta [Actinomycetota bacterium]|nr:ATP synthase F1 subunit delta [Actinomycetota bacterium]